MTMRLEIHEVAKICHDSIGSYLFSAGDFSSRPWAEIPDEEKQSLCEVVNSSLCRVHQELAALMMFEDWKADMTTHGWSWGLVINEEHKEHPMMALWADLAPSQQAVFEIMTGIILGLVRAGVAPEVT